MLNTKLNLYNPDWIELVFANRNKAYGAFELRQHYGLNMLKAMLIGFTTIVAAAVIYTYVVGKTPGEVVRVTEFTGTVIPPPVVPQQKKPEVPVKATPPSKPLPAVSTTKFLPPVVKPTEQATEPPIIEDIAGEVGQVTAKGKGTVPQIEDPKTSTGGTGIAPEDKSIHDFRGLETMPEPVGGVAAWSKFLNKNLRFPAQAQDAGKGGRVIVSFVIEKDGRLSDIVVKSGAGYGMDEEALRVLKLAKPWKPGVQNGQLVRVGYEIPMNFQVNEE